MPNYDYKCDTCSSQREVYKEFGDDTVPVCCEKSMTRVWSAPGVKFNAPGFYSTGGQMKEKRIGNHWLQYGRTDGIALGFNISKYFIGVDFLFWFLSVEL